MSSDNEDERTDVGGVVGSADEEETLPKATISKIISEQLPPTVHCPRETRELLMDCCIEFIHLLTGEANDVCEGAGRKTINPEHIIEALQRLGFTACLQAVQDTLDDSLKHHQREKERVKASNKMESSGLSPEELQRQQEELFLQARLKYFNQLRQADQAPSNSSTD